MPFIVGGTGLYINSLVDNIRFDETKCDYDFRDKMKKLAEEKGNEHLLNMLKKVDEETANCLHCNNLSRIIRALEVYYVSGVKMSDLLKNSRLEPSPFEVCKIAINYNPRQILYDRINKRVDIMLQNGLLEEAKAFINLDKYKTARQAIGYKELLPFINGKQELQACAEKLKQETRNYAKRQLTWFRKDDGINWIEVEETTKFDEIFQKAKKIIKKL